MTHGAPIRRKKGANDDDDDEGALPVPPDGGWGWVVVFASFMVHVITDGMTYSFGIFYVEFLEHFKEGKGYTAWICSILVGVTLCSGPISSAFVNKYGCRAVTIAGSLLAGLCIIASVWAKNVITLIFTIGIGTGFGLGLIYLPAIVSVTMYFEKYRSLATGIAVCGSGFGTFIFAPLTEYLIGQFTWRGALLIIAGIVLNCILFGALFRPLEATHNSDDEESSSPNNVITEADVELQELKSGDEFGDDISYPRNNSIVNITKDSMTRSKSYGHSIMKNGGGNHSHHSNHPHHQHHHNHVHYNDDGSMPNRNRTLSHPHLVDEHGDQIHFKGSHRSISKITTLSRPDIFYQGSLYNIPNYRSTHDLNASCEKYGSFRKIEEPVTPPPKCCGCISVEGRTTFMEMMNFDLLHDPVFVIFTISNFCTSIGFNVPYVYLAAQADALGIPKEKASYLLAVIGIANTVGRIILGYLADKPWVNRLLVYNVCLTCCGIATFLSIFCTDFYSLAVYAAVFGFTIGAYVGLTSVILVDLLGLDKLTNAFGLLLMFQGIASLVGPPFAGTLYDWTSSYAPGFILGGVTIAISGVILFAIPPMQRHYARKRAALDTI